MDNSISIPLDLPNVRVLEVSKTEERDWLIKVESTLKSTICKQCGREIADLHCHNEPVRLRHLPLFEVPVYVEFRPKRYRCPDCDGHPTTTEQPEWHEPHSPNTKPYEHWLLRMLINSTVSDVSRKLGVSEDVVTGPLKRWVSCEVDWSDFSDLKVIGIDEIALKRGHDDFVVLITVPTPDGVEILAVLPDRKKQTVSNFLASIPMHLKQSIERVCSDMYRGFTNAIQEQLPEAKIVIDRFHVAKGYRSCADAVRKQEVKQLKKELSKDEYEQIKGAMWPFRKRPEYLKNQEWELLERLFAYSPKLEQTYQFREELTALFDSDYSKSGAKCALRAWCKRVRGSGLTAFDSFMTTLESRLDEISNYFLERLTSGFVEGFNNRVKVMKRRCYGIFNIKHIFQRLNLDLNGYEKFGRT